MKVVVAMSGGVDSSVTAALLKQEGHQVIGATLRLFKPSPSKPDAATEAQKAAQALGIPHHIIDLQDIFHRTIISDFSKEYKNGRTPNPCVRCNGLIKFGLLADVAREMGAVCLATGHYARIENDSNGKKTLKKGKDLTKDQSYFLCRLTEAQLAFTLFPLGELTKKEVRQIAKEMGLPAAEKPESQEICFIPDNDYAAFLNSYDPSPAAPGDIVDGRGKTVGLHKGIMYYTVGQRKGLNISAPEPLYVTTIDAENNRVVVGSKDETYRDELTARDLNWISRSTPRFPLRVKARVRYRAPEVDAEVTQFDNETVKVKFSAPQMAIAPGQTVVFYDGDCVIGGGTIAK